MRYAIIDESGVVKNVVELEPNVLGTGWIVSSRCQVVQTDMAVPGGTYKDGVFFPPPSPPILKANVERERVRTAYDTWRMWKAVLDEAKARNMAAGIITGLTNKTDAVWSALLVAFQEWQAAS